MQLTTVTVSLVLLSARVCRANIVFGSSRPDESVSCLVEDLVNIVTSCYPDRIETIGLAGNLPDTLIRTLSVRHLIPVATIGNTYTMEDTRELIPVHVRHKLHVFIVEGASFLELDCLVRKNLQYSVWWNHMASVFILDMSPNCAVAHDYMYLAWQAYLLNAKVICNDRNEYGRNIISYNPYTVQAPIGWKQYMTFPGIDKHPFTVFKRTYRGNKTICVNLDFEKTNNLGGSRILVEGFDVRMIRTQWNVGAYHYTSKISRLFETFGNVLNATIKFSGQLREGLWFPQVIKRQLTWIAHKWEVGPVTYPHQQYGFFIVSQFRGLKSQLSKILSVVDRNSQFGMGIVYLISFIFFKFFVRQALVPAFLNLIRLTCNTAVTNFSAHTGSRIYFGCLLFFVVTMQGIYQGKLASLLTTNIPIRDANTIQDLVDYGFNEICGTSGAKQIITHPVGKKYFTHVTENNTECLTRVSQNPLTAYVGFVDGPPIDTVQEYNLHVSSRPIESTYICFDIQWVWVLEERVNEIIQKIVEADVFELWELKCDAIKLADFEFDAAVKNNQVFKNIALNELAFAFAILGIGLACAIITLIAELAVQYKFHCMCRVWFSRR